MRAVMIGALRAPSTEWRQRRFRVVVGMLASVFAFVYIGAHKGVTPLQTNAYHSDLTTTNPKLRVAFYL